MLKNELRAALTMKLRALTAAQRMSASAAICAAIRAQPAWSAARVVCAYLPLPSEPQIAELWEQESAREFCFPRVRGSDVELIQLNDPALRRRVNWKLEAEELAVAPIVAPESVDLVLVPGLGFTRSGKRLGRGGGFYDRLLARRGAASTALGLCFTCQLLTELPAEPHDQNVDAVLAG